jgi:thiol-disulfide isomerase/thioredoxin
VPQRPWSGPVAVGRAASVHGLFIGLNRDVAVWSALMQRLIPLATVILVLLGACASAEPAASMSTTPPAAEPGTASTSATLVATETEPPAALLPDLGPAGELVGIEGWLQSDVGSLEDLRGSVVVVQFWTFGCHNCKATLPNLEALYAEHRGADFEIVGVHSPEFDYEKDPAAITEAAARLGVTWPIAMDTRRQSFHVWQGSPAYWPRTYVLDRQGRIRFDHIGEGAYEELNAAVATLLG